MKLLLMEDNERVARFVKKGLIEAGHIVDHSDNGRDGMSLAAGEHYNAVIMDRMLHFDPQTDVVDVHISKLHQKIDAGGERQQLRTVRNAGYMLTTDV
jgi:DNA-binding response OmpR family regulator